jgi:hypothetical protein
MSSRPKRYRKTKDPDPTENQNLPIDENEETNSIRSDEEAVEEHKSNASINNNAKNDDHDQSSNKSGDSSGKNIDSSTSVDPPDHYRLSSKHCSQTARRKRGRIKLLKLVIITASNPAKILKDQNPLFPNLPTPSTPTPKSHSRSKQEPQLFHPRHQSRAKEVTK